MFPSDNNIHSNGKVTLTLNSSSCSQISLCNDPTAPSMGGNMCSACLRPDTQHRSTGRFSLSLKKD